MNVPVTLGEAEVERLRLLLAELYEWGIDACQQATGHAPGDTDPTWHMFMSTYEWADDLFPRVRRELGR